MFLLKDTPQFPQIHNYKIDKLVCNFHSLHIGLRRKCNFCKTLHCTVYKLLVSRELKNKFDKFVHFLLVSNGDPYLLKHHLQGREEILFKEYVL